MIATVQFFSLQEIENLGRDIDESSSIVYVWLLHSPIDRKMCHEYSISLSCFLPFLCAALFQIDVK